jgi:hypothetical protein
MQNVNNELVYISDDRVIFLSTSEMGPTENSERSRTSNRKLSGDAYTGSKKQQFYFWRKPLSSNKWDSYGN